MDKAKKIVFSFLGVLAVILVVVTSTYAFFRGVVNGTGDEVTGQTLEGNDYNVVATTIYKANKLIPVSEETVDYAVDKDEDNCRDDNNRDVCTLIQIDVSGGNQALNIYGFVKTKTSSYTTNNVKFKVYAFEDDVYVPVTDAAVVSNVSNGVVHFTKNSANYATSIAANDTETLYVAFWISEISAPQNADQDKDLNCVIGFEGIGGAQVSNSFGV